MRMTACRRRQFLAAGAMSVFSLTPGFTKGAEPNRETKAKDVLEKIAKELEPSGKGYLSMPPKDGQFLSVLVKIARAQNILEIGTSIGTSAIWIAMGLEETGGKLTTIEILEDRVVAAKDNLAKAGLAHRVTFKQGNAHDIVPALEGPYDIVLLDADKEGQLDYFNKLYPNKVTPGGMFITQNAIRMREPLQEYLAMIGKHLDFDTVILSASMDDGFAVSYRHRK
jgi:caffeoyl-CoA O-methyltransferase